MSLTASQQAAIQARGNVLVVAGAGTGKTRTLVERCLNCLTAETPRASLDEILMVTFTEAAAAEMRQRIRGRLEEQLSRSPQDAHWQEQLALFETAHIGTLHSFCLELVRQHFYELELDPQLTVMAEEEAAMLADETLNALLEKHYAGRDPGAIAVQKLIQAQGGWDEPIRRLVLRLHHYTQTLPDPEGWLEDQLTLFAEAQPFVWRKWLLEGLAEWRARSLVDLAVQEAGNQIAEQSKQLLDQLSPKPDRESATRVLAELLRIADQCPRGKKLAWLKPLKNFIAEAEFLLSVTEAVPTEKAPDAAASTGSLSGNSLESDPLTQDWRWIRPHMTTLLQLGREFSRSFTEAKRELGTVDFHDLEQYSLRLLWDKQTNQPTAAAQHWREKLRFIFVDEYQDINSAQDRIIEALSRSGAAANRFLVGDVKQSIYRFRQANPYIFQSYVEKWGIIAGNGQVIPLVENFRSQEGLLDFVNSLFGLLLRGDLSGMVYDEKARLRFGAADDRRQLAWKTGASPVVELHVRFKGNNNGPDAVDEETEEALAEVSELEESAKEARLVASQLVELRKRQQPVWDERLGQFRSVEWRDMAVLLRSPANKAEAYAKEFARFNVPLEIARGGFYESLEILDLLNFLQILDNPLQDLPLLAVLRSPLVGLTLNELAAIRYALPKAHFWTALVRRHENSSARHGGRSEPGAAKIAGEPLLESKLGAFLDQFSRWRRLAREAPLSRCLEAILAETRYADFLLTQPRGEQRRANVQQLLGLAEDFNQFQRQGLFRFLRFIEAQQAAQTEPEVPHATEENAVRLMSIHQSKGLEFPVVLVADLGKPFNLSDLRAEIILDETYGLCPPVRPPHTNATYPSLPYWLARRRQRGELLGEELRLLYVAMTRARDLLVLTGSVTKVRLENIWTNPVTVSPVAWLSARCYADWLGLWFSQKAPEPHKLEGRIESVRWIVHTTDEKLIARGGPKAAPLEDGNGDRFSFAPEQWEKLESRLSWQYRFSAATRLAAKSSVSRLRRQVAMDEDESAALDRNVRDGRKRATRADRHNLTATSAVDIGTAHHRFLQLVSLELTGTVSGLKQEANRLQGLGALAPEEVESLNFTGLAQFWNSELGRRIQTEPDCVHRELEFTARFGAAELARLTDQPEDASLAGEFVVVQGIADLAVIRPEEIWLVDFKTDDIEQIEERAKSYALQLQLYALALARVYGRPVTGCWLYFLAAQRAVAVRQLA